MEFYIEDEDFGKCRKHPSQPRHGVCAACLRDRLTVLCPDCARLRPCACCSFSDFTSSASSSSSLDAAATTGSGGVGGAPMSFLIEREPPLFRRSKSVAFSFLRPKTGETSTSSSSSSFARRPPPPENPTKSSSSFWSFLKSDKPKKKSDPEQDSSSAKKKTGNFPRSKSVRYPRSRSVGASCYSDMGEVSGGLKGWGWYFPSPMKVFLHPKTGKVARERSPLCRG